MRDDVWLRYQREKQPLLAGPLSIGYAVYGGNASLWTGAAIRACRGRSLRGASLAHQNRVGGQESLQRFSPAEFRRRGWSVLHQDVADVKAALAQLEKDFPGYRGQGYELAGFVWYKAGTMASIPRTRFPSYEQNLVNLINDVRKEWNAPSCPS